MVIANWNMQGASHSTENKWNTGVSQLLTMADVCCLQECGGVPDSAQLIQQNVAGIQELDLYTWGTERTVKYILYFPWDINGNRCNLAVVSNIPPDDPASDCFLLYPLVPPIYRPVIGMMINNIAIFTIHGMSPGGNDAPGLINSVDVNMRGIPWSVSGDYNRKPDTMTGTGGVVCPPDQNTYKVPNTTKKIDYTIINAGSLEDGQVITTLAMSDHYPVIYQV